MSSSTFTPKIYVVCANQEAETIRNIKENHPHLADKIKYYGDHSGSMDPLVKWYKKQMPQAHRIIILYCHEHWVNSERRISNFREELECVAEQVRSGKKFTIIETGSSENGRSDIFFNEDFLQQCGLQELPKTTPLLEEKFTKENIISNFHQIFDTIMFSEKTVADFIATLTLPVPQCIPYSDEIKISDIATYFRFQSEEKKFRHFPIIDNDGHLKGLLSYKDILSASNPTSKMTKFLEGTPGDPSKTLVREKMKDAEKLTVTTDKMGITSLIEQFISGAPRVNSEEEKSKHPHISSVLVVDQDSNRSQMKIQHVISYIDILRFIQKVAEEEGNAELKKVLNTEASEVMEKEYKSLKIKDDQPFISARNLIIERDPKLRVRDIPVIDGIILKGAISTYSVLRHVGNLYDKIISFNEHTKIGKFPFTDFMNLYDVADPYNVDNHLNEIPLLAKNSKLSDVIKLLVHQRFRDFNAVFVISPLASPVISQTTKGNKEYKLEGVISYVDILKKIKKMG